MKLIIFRNDTLNNAIDTSIAAQEYVNNTKRFDNMSVKLIYLECVPYRYFIGYTKSPLPVDVVSFYALAELVNWTT